MKRLRPTTTTTLLVLAIALLGTDVWLRLPTGGEDGLGTVLTALSVLVGVGLHGLGFRATQRGSSSSHHHSLWWARWGFAASLALLAVLSMDALVGWQLVFWEPRTPKVAGAILLFNTPLAFFAFAARTRSRHREHRPRSSRSDPSSRSGPLGVASRGASWQSRADAALVEIP